MYIKQLKKKAKLYMEIYRSWLDRAKSSYELATMTGNDKIYYEDLCFQIQQAVEKSLKGLLVYYGVEPEFTHNQDCICFRM